MEPYQIVIFLLLALLSEIAGTVGGFGSSVFFVPICSFFFDFTTVLGVTGFLHVFSNISKLILFGKYIKLKETLLIGIPSVLFVIIGAILTHYVQLKYAEAALGLFLVCYSLLMLVKPKAMIKPTPVNAISGGALAGLLAGFIGTGGAVRGLCLSAFSLEKSAFISTSAVIDLGVDVSRSVVYIGNGYLATTYYPYLIALVLIAFIGSYIGKKLVDKISQQAFQKVVLIFILLIGLYELFSVF